MKITGKVQAIIFHNESNGYTVMVIKSSSSITAVGETFEIEAGDEVELEGNYTTHKDYGQQFSFKTCVKIMPKDSVALIQYIADNVKGIGKKTAKNIVNMFGEDVKDVIRFSPNRLLEVQGMNEEKIEVLNDFFTNEWEKWNAVEYLASFGVSSLTASRIFDVLKEETITIVKENPYSLLEFVRTLDFKTIDMVGLNQGIAIDNKSRIRYGILHFLNVITEFGHTCIDEEFFKKYACENLRVDLDVIESGIASLRMSEDIYISEIDGKNYIFRKALYLAEQNIASHVAMHAKQIMPKVNYEKKLNEVKNTIGITLSEKQKEATINALSNSISVITGGPGTGKTTIIKCIIEVLTSMKKSYVLTAPTGRAAKRISETTSKQAKTMHRLLEISKIDDRDLDTFLNYIVKTIEAEVVIVDEASMIDTLMMNNLFKAIKPTTQVILVGDVNQLPSVGPGNVLKDIIDSNVVVTTELNEIYRQSKESSIIVNAHRVNSGLYPEFQSKDSDLYFIKSESMDEALGEITSLVSYRLSNFANINPMLDLQVLTPTKKTDLGTINLNKVLQNILNPKKDESKCKEIAGKEFRQGDKVMQIINNYDKEFVQGVEMGAGIYNGDIGYVTNIDNMLEKLTVLFEDGKEIDYDFKELDQLELAYAITVHKSQGSEYDYVILPIYSGYPKLFTRNLLYTAMTRAKKMLIIIGNRNMVNYMVDNIGEKNRKTGLKTKIIENI
ncbi:MAG: ATP-dependent RecD-like DNA helicase [Clostridia bacterium]|nr:ATP-dependent RecD-like DNA helicase [Clostridia bacterium]